MNAEHVSWRLPINLIFDLRIASRVWRFSSPGTANMYSTPSSSRHWTNKSDDFMGSLFIVITNYSLRVSNVLLISKEGNSTLRHVRTYYIIVRVAPPLC